MAKARDPYTDLDPFGDDGEFAYTNEKAPEPAPVEAPHKQLDQLRAESAISPATEGSIPTDVEYTFTSVTARAGSTVEYQHAELEATMHFSRAVTGKERKAIHTKLWEQLKSETQALAVQAADEVAAIKSARTKASVPAAASNGTSTFVPSSQLAPPSTGGSSQPVTGTSASDIGQVANGSPVDAGGWKSFNIFNEEVRYLSSQALSSDDFKNMITQRLGEFRLEPSAVVIYDNRHFIEQGTANGKAIANVKVLDTTDFGQRFKRYTASALNSKGQPTRNKDVALRVNFNYDGSLWIQETPEFKNFKAAMAAFGG